MLFDVRQKMNTYTYRVGFRGALFYFAPLTFIITAGYLGYCWMLHESDGPPTFILNFLRFPWLACILVFTVLCFFRAAKNYQLTTCADHSLLSEYFLFIKLREVVVDSAARFRVEVPMPAPGAGAFSPSILFTEPRRFRIGKGLSIPTLTDIVAKLSNGEQDGTSNGG